MNRCTIVIILLLLLVPDCALQAQSYGLSFNSHNVVQEKRTALDLSPGDSLCFTGPVRLDFDMYFKPNQLVYFGYIFRLLDGPQNIDLICSQNTFKLVVGQQLTSIVFDLPTDSLFNHWNRFSLQLDPAQKTAELSVNGRSAGTTAVAFRGSCFKLLWGANDHPRLNTRDNPPMCIRDIRLYDQGKERLHWPLADTSGATSKDLLGNRSAAITNPVWIRPRHLHWEMVAELTVAGNAGVAFDSRQDLLYVAGSDSLWTFRPGQEGRPPETVPYQYENLLLGNQAIYDTLHNQLLDIFIDQHRVVGFHTGSGQWESNFPNSVLTEFWHANKFISPLDSALYIIAGYGQLRYKNSVQRYDLVTRQWDTISTGGQRLTPRYMAALGANPAGDTAWILGGYGSPTGDQMLNPGYYYDLFSYDVRSRSFHRHFALDSSKGPFAFANSLVVEPGARRYYGLIFRPDIFDSQLQLVQGSLDEPGLVYMGTTIPYSFQDIQSFADLYYSPRSRQLLVVTLFFSREEDRVKKTQVRIYTIDFPPEELGAVLTTGVSKTGQLQWWVLAGALLLLTVVLGWWLRRRKAGGVQQEMPDNPVAAEPTPDTTANTGLTVPLMATQEQELPAMMDPAPLLPAIHLFGQFQVLDGEGNDLTKSFPPLLRELFLLILIDTIRNGKGITSETLDELLWHDKPLKDAKNNRSVNIAKLKTILARLGEVTVAKEGSHWQFKTNDEKIHIDYRDFLELTGGTQVLAKADMEKLLHLLERGAFLQQTEYGWLDDVKSAVSNTVIDTGLRYIRAASLPGEAETIIAITNTIFRFDHLNEDALRYKCQSLIALKRHSLASELFTRFTREYKEIYQEEFGQSFNEIIK
ncbi:MAG: hypothetical protein P0Y53_00955 [Candidatus Pseudobacter hemicellulosilyticus]|uniref:Uncharacterized protein n=1 Tax=Candidatus Pseudobacter hemicellulosilyticus TaxID=3121375 RepID=A0AAJ5WSP3_9BACT|nr:MAG: hypothetical protein P0Y53_00955 [Pseudobacter sp.]